MPEITRILTDDHGMITHLVTEEEDRLSVEELAQKLDEGEDYYITLGEGKRYTITLIADDGHLAPTIDDPDGVHTIWDLPQEEDPAEREIPETFDDIEELGEFGEDEHSEPIRPPDEIE
ncbi:MAG: hypothetical protein JST22_17235 [Bacteroidetes bacterium]|nr:hypothetical protein [Bacteroidota bacterium]